MFQADARPLLPRSKAGRPPKGVYVFSPQEIDHAIDRNISVIAHLMTALEQENLDSRTRDHLLLAKSEVTLSNRNLSKISVCGSCGQVVTSR